MSKFTKNAIQEHIVETRSTLFPEPMVANGGSAEYETREAKEENLQNKVGELAIEFSKIKVENEGNELFRKLFDGNSRIVAVEKKKEDKGHKVFVHYKNDEDYEKPFIVTAENYESIMEDEDFPKYPK